MFKKVFISAIVLLVILVSLLYFHRKEKINYLTADVTRGSITSAVEATGTLNPVGNTAVSTASGALTITGGVTVGAQVNGRVINVYVDFNSHVRKGELLAQIDPLPYEQAVKQDQADVANAEASIAVAQNNVLNARAELKQQEASLLNLLAQARRDKATLENNRISYERETVLVKQNYDSKQNLDNARFTYEAQKALVEADKAGIEEGEARVLSSKIQVQGAQKQIRLEQAILQKAVARLLQDKANLSYTRIVSPVDGFVVAKNTDVGQTVVSSFQSPNLFVIAQNLKKMQIDTLVDEADVGKIKTGQTASFTIDAYPDKKFTGKVTQIRNNPISQQNVVDYDVIIYVANPDLKLFPGMTANVSIITSHHSDVLKIPNKALLFVPPQEKKETQEGEQVKEIVGSRVYVLKDGKPFSPDVKLGIGNSQETEVLSGVSQGQKVIVGTTEKKKKQNWFSIF